MRVLALVGLPGISIYGCMESCWHMSFFNLPLARELKLFAGRGNACRLNVSGWQRSLT